MSPRRQNETTAGEQIRRACSLDLEAIVRLCGQLGYHDEPQTVGRRLAALLGEPRHAVLVSEREGEGITGLVHVYTDTWLVVDPTAEIGGLVVAEGRRCRGIGARLLQAAERWASDKGCRRLLVRTNAIRERAHRFYEREGYRLLKSQRVYQRELDRPR
jgi:GNAT superfamily N-acetyltransferase